MLIDEVNFALNKIRKKHINAYFEARENHFMNLILSDDDISIGVYGNSIMEKGKNSFMDVEEIKARLNKSMASLIRFLILNKILIRTYFIRLKN